MAANSFACVEDGVSGSVIANLKGQISRLKKDLSQLQKVNSMNLQKMTAMSDENQALRAYCATLEQKVTLDCKLVSSAFSLPFLQRHLLSLDAKNYPIENISIFLEMAQCGEGIWSLFVKHLGFPTWRTVQEWRKRVLGQMSLSTDALNGEPANVARILSQFLGQGYEALRKRVVLAVDAAGVTPNVVVHKDGSIDGFINHDAHISPEDAAHIRSSLENLRNFIAQNRDYVIKDFFVVLVCPLDSMHGGFPILLHPKGNGAADQFFVSRLVELAHVISQSGVELTGLAFDGDSGYLPFVKEMTGKMLIPDPQRSLSAQNVESLLMFEDMLHLVKCIRYRFVSGSKICPFPCTMETVTLEDFKKVGILDWVLDPSQARKMDDFLPLMMFRTEYIVRAIELGMPHVACTLLPMTLLISAVMERSLSREQRLNYLSTVWAFLWCYIAAYTEIPPAARGQSPTREKGKSEHMQIYDLNSLHKGLSLCFSLSKVISDPRPVHLGALGTHWLEHFFGNIRRLCGKHDGAGNFERCLLVLMMQKLISPDAKMEISPKRLSDSGAILPNEAGPCDASSSIGCFIHEAMILLQMNPGHFSGNFSGFLLNMARFPVRFCQGIHPIISLIAPELREAKGTSCGSARDCRITGAAGFTTRQRDIMKTQI